MKELDLLQMPLEWKGNIEMEGNFFGRSKNEGIGLPPTNSKGEDAEAS